ncbi:MAG: type II toxin-antitoxin system VapC family toxin [Actinomycetota bacterium]
MAAFVVDASVVVEFLAPGRHGEAADRFIGGLAWDDPLELFAPDVLLLEVANALRRLTETKALSHSAADRVVTRLPQLAIAMVATGALLEEAWPLRRRMTIYDGVCAAARIEAFTVDQPELVRLLDTLERDERRD